MARGDSFQLQGLTGGIVLAAGDSVTLAERKTFRWLQVVNDATLSGLGDGFTSSGSDLVDMSKLVGITLPAGLGIGGQFSTIDVTSGVVIVYNM